MPELRIKLETVTPLFLGGADPRGQPELRPPAFRGALRYWLRAALGGAVDYEVMRQTEATIFGSADEAKGGASAITLRLVDNSLGTPQPFVKQKTEWVQKGNKSIPQPSGRDYLYWTMSESGKPEKGNYLPAKKFYPVNGTFDLILNSRPGFMIKDQTFEQTVAALWLLVHLGGIGSRSRRTAGSFSLKEEYEFSGLQFHLKAKFPIEVSQELARGLNTARKWFEMPAFPSVLRSVPDFDVLHPQFCRIWVLGIWEQSAQAVEAIGKALRDFRTYSNPDHDEVAKWLKGTKIDTVKRAVFGLPLPYRYSEGPAGIIQGRPTDPKIERRASPLWLKVSKTATGHYVGVATLFKSAFLPVGENLYVTTKNSSPPAINQPSDYTLIEDWIMTSFPKGQEVHYA